MATTDATKFSAFPGRRWGTVRSDLFEVLGTVRSLSRHEAGAELLADLLDGTPSETLIRSLITAVANSSATGAIEGKNDEAALELARIAETLADALQDRLAP